MENIRGARLKPTQDHPIALIAAIWHIREMFIAITDLNYDLGGHSISRRGLYILQAPNPSTLFTQIIHAQRIGDEKMKQELRDVLEKNTTEYVDALLNTPGLSAIEKRRIYRTWHLRK